MFSIKWLRRKKKNNLYQKTTIYNARKSLLQSLNKKQWLALAILLGKEYPMILRDKEEILYSIGKED